MALDIRQLRYVVEVADAGNVSRAAERVGIAQPALSQQILKVERELGFDLFVRHPRGAAITEAGQEFVVDARAAVAAFDDAVDRAGRRARGETGRLTVGFTPGAALELTPLILTAFAARYPRVDVRLREADYSDASAGLADGRADVAFLRPPLGMKGLWFEVLREEPRVIAVSTDHPLAMRESVGVSEILDLPMVGAAGADDAWARFWLLDEFRDGEPATIATHADSYEAELQLVASGRAVSVTCAASAQYFARPGVAFVPIDDVPPSELVVARRAGEAEPLVQNFVRLAVEIRDAQPSAAVGDT